MVLVYHSILLVRALVGGATSKHGSAAYTHGHSSTLDNKQQTKNNKQTNLYLREPVKLPLHVKQAEEAPLSENIGPL